MKKYLHNLKARAACAAKSLECFHPFAHAVYFGAVAAAGHWYSLAASLLLIVTIVQIGRE